MASMTPSMMPSCKVQLLDGQQVSVRNHALLPHYFVVTFLARWYCKMKVNTEPVMCEVVLQNFHRERTGSGLAIKEERK